MALAIHEADDLNAALAAVLEGVCTTTGWACGQVWLPLPDDITLACSCVWCRSDEGLKTFSTRGEQGMFESGTGLPGAVWSTKQPVWSDNITLNTQIVRGPFAQETELRAAVAFPAFARSEIVAVLEFFAFEALSADQRSMELVSAVVAQLGSFIRSKRAEDALRRSEARYRAVVDTASDAIITMTADGTIQSFNRGAEHAFGYAAAEVIGQPLALLMPERVREQYRSGFLSQFQIKPGRILGRPREAIGRRRNGTEFPLEVTVTEVQEAQGSLFTAILRNITQRKLTEVMLARQAATLRWQAQLLDLAHDAILVRDFHTDHILLWNQGAEAVYGWTAAEALGQPLHVLLHTDSLQPWTAINAALLQDERWDGELTQITREGAVIVVASRWAVQRNEQGEPVSVLEINSDITERKRVEMERAALLAAEQEHSKRLCDLAALKADFTAMVAHELASPLSAIRIFADLLAAGDNPPEQQAEMIAAIQNEVHVLTSLVSDVRASAAIERDDFSVRRRPVTVKDLLSPMVAFAETLPGAHFVELTLVDRIVLADTERIGQVLRNLLSNAANYSLAGTPIELRALGIGSRVRIEVTDHGLGIHPQDLQRIFEKFGRGRDQTGRRVPGVGLGLYLSRRIIQLHGTDLEVRSTPGAGSTFAFELEAIS
ncbi:MAG TPA: PAS domain S-box protein [Herpetosiphonaceae bacterium]